MKLRVLSVAYPLAPVGPDRVGGAEQILSALDQALVAAGHRSIVIAAEGSEVSGTLVSLPYSDELLDETVVRRARECCRAQICDLLAREHIDLVHMHGVDFFEYLPPRGPPVLATLHLPASFYPAHALRPERPNTYLNCVSQSQHATCAPNPYLLPPIPNGVAIPDLPGAHKQNYALVLARICPEKGIHLALDAAKRAEIPLILAGEVFRYRAHLDYFEEMIKPRLDHLRRYIGPIGREQKARLLAEAQCVLVTSLVPETSSLVTLEALAAGTPVIGFPNGALPEAIEHGRTGFLVRDAAEMAEAIPAVATIDPDVCRSVACERFSLARMTGRYLALYRDLAARSGFALAAEASA